MEFGPKEVLTLTVGLPITIIGVGSLILHGFALLIRLIQFAV